jgi:branched-chain amino acid transport system substrate-binding protein
MKKELLITFLSLLMAGLFAAPQNAATKEPIKIGLVLPFTGIIAQSAVEQREGVEMAVKEKGTILGRPIQLIIEDTRLQPDVAVSKAEKLVYKDGCIALAGTISSGVALALSKNINRLKVPLLVTGPMTTKLYSFHKWVFRSGQLINDQTARANVAGILARPDLRNRTYYVLCNDFTWGHDASEWFIKLAKEKGIKIYNEDYDKAPMATKDWASYITKIKASGADAVYIALFTNVIPLFTKQAYDFGYLPENKLVSAAAPGPRELEAGGKSCTGIVTSTNWSWDINTPTSDTWEKKSWEMYKPNIPSNMAVNSYVGAMNLFNGIEKAGSTDVNKIAKALKGISFDGPYGVVRISPKDNNARSGAVLIETKMAGPNLFGAKVVQKVLHHFKAEELGPPE